MNFAIFISLLVLGYLFGRYREKRHLNSIVKREEELLSIPIISGEWKNTITPNEEGRVFGGGIVIASDYFKTFVAGLRSFVGGRLTSYESLLDRGRREALLKMKAKAANWGAHKIVNLRIETASIGGTSGKRALPCVEIYVYGTAIRDQSLFTEEDKKSSKK